jgi:excisionase family DNA binding protein
MSLFDDVGLREMVASAVRDALPSVRAIVREELAHANEIHPDTLLSVRDVASRLRITDAAVLKAIERRSLKAHKVGHHWRIRLGDLMGQDAGRYRMDDGDDLERPPK